MTLSQSSLSSSGHMLRGANSKCSISLTSVSTPPGELPCAPASLRLMVSIEVQLCCPADRGHTTLSWLSKTSSSSTSQTQMGASSEPFNYPFDSNPLPNSIPIPPAPTRPSSGPPLLTGRQRMAPPTVNPSRSSSRHTKGTQRKAVGIYHCRQTERKVGPAHSPPTANPLQKKTED